MFFKPLIALLSLHKLVPDRDPSRLQQKQKLKSTNEEAVFSKAVDNVGHNGLHYALKSAKITENINKLVHCSLV